MLVNEVHYICNVMNCCVPVNCSLGAEEKRPDLSLKPVDEDNDDGTDVRISSGSEVTTQQHNSNNKTWNQH